MTWQMTLAGLPRAGAISKPHDYKQNVQKLKSLLKKWVLTGKQVEDFKPKKNQRFHSSHREQNKKTTRPQYRKLNMNHVATKLLTEAKVKKAFRINDAGRATTCRRNFKAPWLQTEGTKNEGCPEKMNFNAETVWKFQTKKNQKIQSSYGE